MASRHLGTKRRGWRLGVGVTAIAAAVLTAVTLAQAAPKLTDSVIGTTSSGNTGGLFNTPRDIAANGTGAGGVTAGTFYVVDQANHRIQRFAPAGSFERAWGADVVSSGPGNTGTGFEICVAANGDVCKAGVASGGIAGDNSRNGALDDPQGIVIDQDTGSVYVSNRDNRRIDQYTANGIFVRSWGFDVSASVNESQTITIDATGGTFKLTFGASTTGDIPYNASAATLQAAFQGLTSIGAGNATVTGGPGGSAPYAVTFTGALAGTNVDQIATDSTLLTAGASTATANTVQNGSGAGTAFEICVATDRCKAGVAGGGAGQFGAGATVNTYYLAVTPGDGNAATGKVYLANSQNQRVEVYNLDGTLATPSSIGGPAYFTGTAANSRLRHVAVDSNGVLYAANNTAPYVIQRFDANTGVEHPNGPISGAALLGIGDGGNQGVYGLEIDPQNGRLLVARGTLLAGQDATVQEIGSPGGASPSLVDTHLMGSGPIALSGLGVDHAGARDKMFVTVGNQLFALDGDGANPLATGTPGGPTEIGSHQATLQGTVNPNGVTAFPTAYYFELSKDGVTWTKVPTSDGPFTGGPVVVDDTVTGLEANTFYRVRLVTARTSLIGSAGSSVSAEAPFLTDAVAPTVETLELVSRTGTDAVVQANVNPEGSPTTYHFEYVSEAQFASTGWTDAARVPQPAASAGSGGQSQRFTERIDGLQPGTAYRYRVVATNGQAVDPIGNPGDVLQEGNAVLFTTRPEFQAPGGRGYEIVSPPDKAVGNGPGQHFQNSELDGENGTTAGIPAVSGDRAIFYSDAAVMVPGAATFVYDHAIADRGPTGWARRSAFTRRNYAERQIAPFLTLMATDPELSLFTWRQYGGAYAINLFEEMMAAGYGSTDKNVTYLADSAGSWEFFGPQQAPEGNTTSQRAVTPGAMSADGRHAVMTNSLIGAAGMGDPSRNRPGYDWNQLPGTWSTYIHDVAPGGLSDTFPGAGLQSNVAACDSGTLIPEINDNGTDAGPPGGPFFATVNFASGATAITTAFGTFSTDVRPGHFVTGTNIAPGTRVVSRDSDTQITINTPTAGTGTFASITIGQSAANLADDFVDAQACPPAAAGADAAQVSRRGASLSGAGTGGSNIDGTRDLSLNNVISGDGSRVFFQSPDARVGSAPQLASCAPTQGQQTDCPPQLFVRQRNDGGDVAVRWISRSDALMTKPSALLGPAYFEGASASGDRVFFRTTSPLTANDPNAGSSASAQATSWDLYMYDLASGDDPAAGGELTRVSAGPNGNGDCNVVQQLATSPGGDGGALRYASEEGDRVYFTCNAALPGVPGATNGALSSQGGAANQPTTTGTTNLYMYENDGSSEEWTFVTQLPRARTNSATMASCATTNTQAGEPRRAEVGNGDFHLPVGVGSSGSNCVRGTSDASFITFWTDGRLVADDPDAVSGDMYAFDAEADELVRISAPQGGEGTPYLCVSSSNTQCYGDPGYHNLSGPANQPRSQLGMVTDPANPGDRTVFFQSKARLVPEDVNSKMDVYQWKNGVLSLISSGTSPHGAFYSGNSADGQDVFLVTSEQMTWEDVDALRDMYDVRIGGGFDEPPLPVACDIIGDACQPPAPRTGSDPVPPGTSAPGGGDAPANARTQLTVGGKMSRKLLRRAALSGTLPVTVTTSQAGVVKVTATGKLGAKKKASTVGRGSRRVTKAGPAKVNVKLTFGARQLLRKGKPLRVTLRVTQGDARPRTLSVTVRR